MARCDIELLDDVEDADGVHVAKSFRINGEEILLPQDARLSITAGTQEPTVVTVSLMATSVRIAKKATPPAGPAVWPAVKDGS